MIPLWTLQRYIFRDMGRSFILSSVALTAVLGLGGGVMNLIKLGSATPMQLLQLMGMILPVAAGFTLPIAALFSAAQTYGRLSADNEFVACRSSGINIHLLFIPCILVSLVSGSLTFAFSNYLVPGMVRNLNEFVQSDIASMIQQRLNRPRGISLQGKMRIRADECIVDPEDSSRIALGGITFVEGDADAWVRFGTADQVILQFVQDVETPHVSGEMLGLSYYDRDKGQFMDTERLSIPVNDLPSLMPPEIKFLTLTELLHFGSKPAQWREVKEELAKLRQLVGQKVLYDALVKEWIQSDKTINLSGEHGDCTFSTEAAARVVDQGGLEFSGIKLKEIRDGHNRVYTAKRGLLELSRGDAMGSRGIELQLFDVHVVDGGREFDRAKDSVGPFRIEEGVKEETAQFTTADLTAEAKEANPKSLLGRQLIQVEQVKRDTIHRISSTINERVAFSFSVLVLVILGATLGIIMRGAHVLTAFGISFIPSLCVIVTIVMGRQMAQNDSSHGLGIALIWSGIVVVAVLDYWAMTRVLRR